MFFFVSQWRSSIASHHQWQRRVAEADETSKWHLPFKMRRESRRTRRKAASRAELGWGRVERAIAAIRLVIHPINWASATITTTTAVAALLDADGDCDASVAAPELLPALLILLLLLLLSSCSSQQCRVMMANGMGWDLVELRQIRPEQNNGIVFVEMNTNGIIL